MKIRYEGRRGLEPLILGGVQDEDARVWWIGQEREFAADAQIRVRTPGGIVSTNAIEHVLAVGPEFIDVDQGKNPMFACAVCGELALNTHFFDTRTDQVVEYRDAEGRPLCLRDFLVANPQYLAHHTRTVFDRSVINEAKRKIYERDRSDAPPPATAASASSGAASSAPVSASSLSTATQSAAHTDSAPEHEE